MTNAPAISIIIALYNAERYIGETLDNILAQTFQNFEVIVVDDCSTDNSVMIVTSYLEKFGGRLRLSRMKKNSGRPSLPRNKGLLLSRGEYIFFMDNDDLITSTALEELYTLAKNYTAEVVYCEHYYIADVDNKNIQKTQQQNSNFPFVDKPTFETNSFPDKVNRVIEYLFVAMPWNYMVKRKLLIENKIIFPDIIRDDSIWTWNVVFCAKKILRIPNAVYIWRENKSSITRVEKTPTQVINFWLDSVIRGTKTLHETLNRIKFFQENPKFHYDILRCFIYGSFREILEAKLKIEPDEFYETVRKKFSKNLGEYDVLVPLLCAFIDEQQRLIQQLKR